MGEGGGVATVRWRATCVGVISIICAWHARRRGGIFVGTSFGRTFALFRCTPGEAQFCFVTA